MAKLCKSCGGPLCPICGGCIQEGECGCHSHTAEVERLRDELSRAAGLAMALMAHVPDDLLVGNLRPRALAFCREWGELQGHVDGVRAEIQAEREACAAIADAMAADAVAAREIFGEREDIAKNVYREFGHLVFETARAIAAAIRAR